MDVVLPEHPSYDYCSDTPAHPVVVHSLPMGWGFFVHFFPSAASRVVQALPPALSWVFSSWFLPEKTDSIETREQKRSCRAKLLALSETNHNETTHD